MNHSRIALALALVAIAPSCKDKKDGGSSAKTTEREHRDEPAAKKKVTAEFFGKAVTLPGHLAKLAWGMPVADAKKAAPELFKDDKDYQLVDDPELDGISYGISIDKETKLLSGLDLQVSEAAKPLIVTAWGAGTDAKDTIGRARVLWFNPETGWRARMEEGYPGTWKLEFRPYLPIAKLLGDGPDTLGFAPQGILGASLTDLRTRFGPMLIETNAAQAAAKQKEIGAFVGKDLDKEVGKAKPSVRIDLPATEWAEFWIRVEITWDDTGKVSGFYFGVPYEAVPTAKDELHALFEKKWGKPKPGEYLAQKVEVFHAKAPWIAVQEDTISKAWDVHVEAKPPEL